MPLITLTLRKPASADVKATVLGAVHDALVSVGVPQTDTFERVLELGADDFRFDATYPDVKTARTERFVLIEVLWSVGRSVKVKKQMLARLMTTLGEAGFDLEQVMVVFVDTTWENWAFAGGRLIHT